MLMKTKKKLRLTIEIQGNTFWGSVWIGRKLIVETAPSLVGLELSIRKVLYDFHCLEPDEISFDLRIEQKDQFVLSVKHLSE